MTRFKLKWIFVMLLFIFFGQRVIGCSIFQSVPEQPENICSVFRENRKWYRYAQNASERWGISIPVMMAIMYHESGFQSDVKPPRKTCLFIFPGPRPSTAYGYAQALDSTWKEYQNAVGNDGADRDDFEDAIDFIGWYCFKSHTRCRIPSNDTYHMYLAYHEGQSGFLNKTYQTKKGLKEAAQAVHSRAQQYQKQLSLCESEFQRKRGCFG